MLYFSELKGKKVYTEDQVASGRLDDLIFKASDIADVTKLLIKDNNNQNIIIPTEFVRKINNQIVIDKAFKTSSLEENELYLLRNLLDKQIIDLKGHKIVRVNDVILQDKLIGPSYQFNVIGVDIGLLGVLRWLRLEGIFTKFFKIFNLSPRSDFLSWGDIYPLELARGQVALKKEDIKLERIRPEDLADYLEKTNLENIKKLIKLLNKKYASDVINNLKSNYQTELFQSWKPETSVKILNYFELDDEVDILLSISRTKRNQIIELMDDKRKLAITKLLNFSSTPVGELLTTEFLSVPSTMIVRQIIDKIKTETADYFSLFYIYGLNEKDQLVGVSSLHELMLHNLDETLFKFMVQNVVSVHLTTPIDIVTRKMIKYKIVALPVIDNQQHLLGIITIDDLSKLDLIGIK